MVPTAVGAVGSSSANCGRTAYAKSTGGYWQCVWSDDFNGWVLNTDKWLVQQTATSGYQIGPECFVTRSGNVRVLNGSLQLTVRKETRPFVCDDPYGDYTTQYTAGTVTTMGKFAQAYGRWEIRAKLAAGKVPGLQTALWLWPQNANKYGAWPLSGEIDIAEMFSSYPDRAIPHIHYVPAAPDPNVTNYYCILGDLSTFHTFALEWPPESLTILYDGKTCLVNRWNAASPLTNPAPFDSPFFLALTQGLGVGGNAFNPESTPLPATTYVDYVRVCK